LILFSLFNLVIVFLFARAAASLYNTATVFCAVCVVGIVRAAAAGDVYASPHGTHVVVETASAASLRVRAIPLQEALLHAGVRAIVVLGRAGRELGALARALRFTGADICECHLRRNCEGTGDQERQ
jgi:hypothetical protein